MSYNILCLDGGGMRGLLTARLLSRLDSETPISGWRNRTHMIAGASTGGLLALGLGAGKSADEIVRFYQNNGPKVFSSSLWRDVKAVDGLLGAKYGNDELQKTLQNLLGSNTILQSLKPVIVIPTFDLDRHYDYADGTGVATGVESWRPRVFHNDKADPGGNHGAELAYKVGMRTSATPVYFPTYGSYVDGGVVANNPSMVALAQALVGRATESQRSLDNLSLLSLGTGVRPSHVRGEDHDWGRVQWLGAGLIDVLLEGGMDMVRYQCQRLLGDRTMRVSPWLAQNIAMDDASDETLNQLIKLADGIDLHNVIEWIKRYWQ